MRQPLVVVAAFVVVAAVGWLWWWGGQDQGPVEGGGPTAGSTGGAEATGSTGVPSPQPDPTEVASTARPLLGAVCAGGLIPAPAGVLDDTELDETSGLAASRRRPDVLWAVEDSLNPSVLHAVRTDGTVLAGVEVEALNFDWEDLAVADGPDGEPWVYVADIGDNFEVRNRVSVLAFPEPDLDDTTVRPEELRFDYADGPVDAEALVVAHSGVWVIAKVLDGAPAALFHAPPGTTTLARVGELDTGGEAVTGADLDAAGTVLVVRTLQRVLLYAVTDGDLRAATTGAPCSVAVPDEPQGESVAMAADGTAIYTVSEAAGATLHVIAAP